MKTKNILLLAATVLSLGVVACGDDGETTSSSGTGGGSTGTGTPGTTSGATTSTGSPTSTSSGEGAGGDGGAPGTGGEGGGTGGAGGEGGSGPPAVPELGPQLERMGRPAINTATVETFITFAGGDELGPTTDVIRSAAEDDYNEAVNGSDEAAAFIETQALQLTVLDSLDGECGNSLAWGLLAEDDCPNSVEGIPVACYAGLATVLNADALWVKTEYESCGIYLGVEADGAAIIPNADCGGRRPVDDVIRTTYSAVSGAVNPADPQIFLFDDGITPPTDLHPDTFPYLAAPHAE